MIYPKRKLKVKWKKEVRTNLKSKMKANSQAKVVKTKTMDTVTKKHERASSVFFSMLTFNSFYSDII